MTQLTKVTVLSLALLTGSGCTTYEQAVKPYVEQYAQADCRHVTTDECRRLQAEMQRLFDSYSNESAHTATPWFFSYTMNPQVTK